MPDLFWSASEDGALDLTSFLERLNTEMGDMRAPLRRTKNYIQNLMTLQFDTEGEYRAGGWVPLTEAYEERKLSEWGERPILEASRDMRKAVLTDMAWEITLHDAVFEPIGPHWEVAGYHQEGADRSRGGHLPARPILVLLESDYEAIEAIFEDWLRDRIQPGNAPNSGWMRWMEGF